ncbi:MAG: DUF2155 domain-containing protein [Neomegalonema sp.]|nr:DUF2155 domain-containing protein [Neomegalonema sp.]
MIMRRPAAQCLALALLMCAPATILAAQTSADDPFAELGPPKPEDEAETKPKPEGAPTDRLEDAPKPEEPKPEPVASIPGVQVTLRGIDKLTGELKTIEAPAPGKVTLWRLEITVAACFRRPAERAPESSAFLQIEDTKTAPATRLFSGWMFASSPALSAMDHPRYDVWVLNCKTP